MFDNFLAKSIDNLTEYNTAIIRVDYNVPIKNNIVLDDSRIKASLETIKKAKEKARKVFLIAHLENEENPSLKPIVDILSNLLKMDVEFIENQNIEEVKEYINSRESGIFLYENIRFHTGEKENNEFFANSVATIGDVYINDAFSVAHRKHASVVGISKFLPSYIGYNFMEEIKALSKSFNPEHPSVFLLGGAKFETKLNLISKFFDACDNTFIGGALMNNVLKESGYEIGKSLVSEGFFNLKEKFIDNKFIKILDIVNQDNIVKNVYEISKEDIILDVGPKTTDLIIEKIKTAKFVVWNGPMGLFEKGFTQSTNRIAREILNNDIHSVIGGGDTVSAIKDVLNETKECPKNIFISTGGGAMLDFLEKGTLPAIDAILNN